MADTKERTLDKLNKVMDKIASVRGNLEDIDCDDEFFREDLINDAYALCDRAQYFLNIAFGELEYVEE
tara:strand:- start:1013 stop:1216 length:204 start_codon:yes stop_codon:yes gene_type:complete